MLWLHSPNGAPAVVQGPRISSVSYHRAQLCWEEQPHHQSRQQYFIPATFAPHEVSLAKEVSSGAPGFHTSCGPAESTHPKFRFSPCPRPGTMFHLCICLKDFTVDQSKVSLLTTVNFGMQEMPGQRQESSCSFSVCELPAMY